MERPYEWSKKVQPPEKPTLYTDGKKIGNCDPKMGSGGRPSSGLNLAPLPRPRIIVFHCQTGLEEGTTAWAAVRPLIDIGMSGRV